MNEKISKILYQNINEFVSGQEIADTLGVSRVAISNSIKELKNKGLDIISISKKGHKLIKLDDILDNDVIAAITGKKTYFLETCESTNIEARKLIEKSGVPIKTIFINSLPHISYNFIYKEYAI